MEKEHNTMTGRRMSDGETEDRAEFAKLRALIMQEPDVYEVLALSWVSTEARWLYCIKTPFATWPKFVVGWTDGENEAPKIIFCCGREENALREFDEINQGEHP